MNDMTAGQTETPPTLPRRVLLAGGLSACVAGAAVGLAIIGARSFPYVEVFQFSRGTTLASGEDARIKAVLAQALQDERISVLIVGHTGVAGDPKANLILSKDRAELIAGLARDMGLPAQRISAVDVGGGNPLRKQPEESDRAHQSRLARVEISLQQGK